MKSRLRQDLKALMLIPGLSGHEERVAAWLRLRLEVLSLTHRTDRLGNLIATIPGDPAKPSVLIFTHMDQLGFFVRKIESDGLIRVERMGGVSERVVDRDTVLVASVPAWCQLDELQQPETTHLLCYGICGRALVAAASEPIRAPAHSDACT